MVPVTADDTTVVLPGCDRPLYQQFQRLLLDLDGVVILVDEPIPAAAETLQRVRAAGVSLRFVTNNASRPPVAVADLLTRSGVSAEPSEVVTSAMAAAALLAGRHPAGARVLVVGGEGVYTALSDSGLSPVTHAEENPVAVMQGFAPEVDWPMLAEAAIALRAGADWVATNTDRTLPSPRGPLPGNGSLVAALTTATGREPESVGKPAAALYDAALSGTDTRHALAVGDRLETDIAGAKKAGVRSLLVLSGVSGVRDLLMAEVMARPDFIGRDLRALDLPHPAAVRVGEEGRCHAARVWARPGGIELSDAGTGGEDGLDRLRALCALAWSHPLELSSDAYDGVINELDLD